MLPRTNKLIQASANSFGSGRDLEGMFYKGKQIGGISTRKNIVCLDGTTATRKGAYVSYYEIDWGKIKSIVNKAGYVVYKSAGGYDPSYTYRINGLNAGLSWDDEYSVYSYLYKKIQSDGDSTAT